MATYPPTGDQWQYDVSYSDTVQDHIECDYEVAYNADGTLNFYNNHPETGEKYILVTAQSNYRQLRVVQVKI